MKWWSRIVWMLLLFALAVLLVDNVVLQLQHAALANNTLRIKRLRAEQVSTIREAKRLETDALKIVQKEGRRAEDLRKMMKWVDHRDKCLVRTGNQLVAQVVSMGAGKIRLIVYIPPGEGRKQQVMFACTEIWGESQSKLKNELSSRPLKAWDWSADLDLESNAVHQLDFRLSETKAEHSLEIAINDQSVHRVAVQPFQRPGSTFGPYFVKAYPNETFRNTVDGAGELLNAENGFPIGTSLMSHSFNLSSLDRPKRHGLLGLRVWLKSDAPPCVSTAFMAAYGPEVYEDLLRTRQVKLENLSELFLADDGKDPNRIYLRPNWVHLIRD